MRDVPGRRPPEGAGSEFTEPSRIPSVQDAGLSTPHAVNLPVAQDLDQHPRAHSRAGVRPDPNHPQPIEPWSSSTWIMPPPLPSVPRSHGSWAERKRADLPTRHLLIDGAGRPAEGWRGQGTRWPMRSRSLPPGSGSCEAGRRRTISPSWGGSRRHEEREVRPGSLSLQWSILLSGKRVPRSRLWEARS